MAKIDSDLFDGAHYLETRERQVKLCEGETDDLFLRRCRFVVDAMTKELQNDYPGKHVSGWFTLEPVHGEATIVCRVFHI